MDRAKIATALTHAGLLGHAFFVPVSIAGTQIGLGVAAAGLLCAPPPRLRTALDWPVVAFVVIAIASDLLSSYGVPPLAAATLWRSVLGFFVVAHGLRLLPPRAATQLICAAAAGVALGAIVGVIQYRTGFDLVHWVGLRANPASVPAPGVPGRFGAMGFFTSRLTYGHNATVLVALFGGVLAAGAVPRRPAFLIAAATALGLAGIAVTFDRAAYLAFCAAALVIAYGAAPRARRALVPVLVALVLLAALHGGVRGRFLTAFSVASNSDRAFIWARAVEMLRDHPLQGVGFANYSKAAAAYYDRVDPSFPMRTWAHNQPFSTLVETGPLGLAALVWIFAAAAAALVRRLRSGNRLAPGGLAALAALAVIAQVHDVFYDTKVMYALWLALGLTLSPRASLEDADEPVEAEIERDAQRNHDQQRRHQQIRQEHAPALEEAEHPGEQLQ